MDSKEEVDRDVTHFDLSYFEKNGIDKHKPLLNLGSGDSGLYLDVISPEVRANLFEKLDAEIDWNVMMHKGGPVPRLISIQAERQPCGSFPLYRHPADEQPNTIDFTETARHCRDEISATLGQSFNHALIQKYRDGKDNISEHADKTLDIARGSVIVNLSVGSTRVMILKSKPDADYASEYGVGDESKRKTKIVQKITLPPNSLFVLGWETNQLFTHAIKADKRQPWEKRPDERAYNEQRISLTFRNIATFIHPTAGIYGQGAKRKELPSLLAPTPDLVDHTQDESPTPWTEEELAAESEKLLHAFGLENRSAHFDWDASYGGGFDVVNFSFVNSTS